MPYRYRMRDDRAVHTLFGKGKGKRPYTLNFSDGFNTADAAPLTDPRTAEPLGAWDVTQPNNTFSISGGELLLDLATVTGNYNTNNMATQDNYTVAAGLGMRFMLNAAGLGTRVYIGFVNTAVTAKVAGMMMLNLNPAMATSSSMGSNLRIVLGDITISTDNEFALIYLASDLAGLFLKASGASDWVLLGVYPALTADVTVKAMIGLSWANNQVAIDDFSVVNFKGNLASDYRLATDRLAGSVSAGTTFTHEADHVGFVDDVGTISATAKVFFVRVQDANNRCQITCDTTSTDFDTVASGTPTQRGTAAALSNNVNLQWRMEGADTEIWSNNTSLITYGSTPYTTATNGEFDAGADVTDLSTFPYTQTGAVKSALEAV